MVAVTYDVARVPTAKTTDAPATPRKNVFARFMDALIESRMEHARREIRRHRHLLPYTFDARSNRLVRIQPDDLPLGGW